MNRTSAIGSHRDSWPAGEHLTRNTAGGVMGGADRGEACALHARIPMLKRSPLLPVWFLLVFGSPLAACMDDGGDDSGHDGGDDSGAGEPCGGLAGRPCGAGDYCDYPDDAACGEDDVSGTCRGRPDVCTPVIDEVCGCDGEVYGNACEANRAGTDVYREGGCLR